MKGKITQWKDDKGFGFIVPDLGGEKIFFHISSVKNQVRRPQVADAVLYDVVRDSQGRLKAKREERGRVCCGKKVGRKWEERGVDQPLTDFYVFQPAGAVNFMYHKHSREK